MNLSRADVARLGRQRLQPVRAEGELLAVFVPGNLVNTKNARLHYMAESRYKRGWRERVATALLEAGWRMPADFGASARRPKTVHFLAQTAKAMDSDDGLNIAVAPVRDALVECRVISGDADRDGHEFRYSQKIDRKQRGVVIRVRLA